MILEDFSKNDVEIINGAPYITSKVKLNAKVLSSSKDSNYFEGDNLALIEEYANSYITSKLEEYLYKTSKDFGSDIDLFGKYAVKHFATWDEWTKYNWLENYSNAFFKVDAKVNVISSYLIS